MDLFNSLYYQPPNARCFHSRQNISKRNNLYELLVNKSSYAGLCGCSKCNKDPCSVPFHQTIWRSQTNYETVNVRIQKLDEKILQTNTEKEMLQKRLKEIDCKLAALQEQRGELMLMKEHLEKARAKHFSLDLLCDIFAFLSTIELHQFNWTCLTLLRIYQILNRPIHRRPYNERVLEKLSITCCDPEMQFVSAEFIFKQPEMLNEQSLPIRYSRNVQTSMQTTNKKYLTMQIGYRSEAPFNEIAEFNKTIDTLQQTAHDDEHLFYPSKSFANYMWLPTIAPPTDVIAIEHICLKLVCADGCSFCPNVNCPKPAHFSHVPAFFHALDEYFFQQHAIRYKTIVYCRKNLWQHRMKQTEIALHHWPFQLFNKSFFAAFHIQIEVRDSYDYRDLKDAKKRKCFVGPYPSFYWLFRQEFVKKTLRLWLEFTPSEAVENQTEAANLEEIFYTDHGVIEESIRWLELPIDYGRNSKKPNLIPNSDQQQFNRGSGIWKAPAVTGSERILHIGSKNASLNMGKIIGFVTTLANVLLYYLY